MSDDPGLIRDWWQQIIAAGGIMWAIFRAEDSRRRVNRLLYDTHGEPRIMTVENYEKQRAACRAELCKAIHDLQAAQSMFISEIREEFQNHNKLHLEIAEKMGKSGRREGD